MKDGLNLSWDDLWRTSDKANIAGAELCGRNSTKRDIYKKSYKGLYCVGQKRFVTQKDLVDGKWRTTIPSGGRRGENYFFPPFEIFEESREDQER